jgi:hypothetical protein
MPVLRLVRAPNKWTVWSEFTRPALMTSNNSNYYFLFIASSEFYWTNEVAASEMSPSRFNNNRGRGNDGRTKQGNTI